MAMVGEARRHTVGVCRDEELRSMQYLVLDTRASCGVPIENLEARQGGG